MFEPILASKTICDGQFLLDLKVCYGPILFQANVKLKVKVVLEMMSVKCVILLLEKLGDGWVAGWVVFTGIKYWPEPINWQTDGWTDQQDIYLWKKETLKIAKVLPAPAQGQGQDLLSHGYYYYCTTLSPSTTSTTPVKRLLQNCHNSAKN